MGIGLNQEEFDEEIEWAEVRGFNAGIRAAHKLVSERYDECEPWIEPHEVLALLKTEGAN